MKLQRQIISHIPQRGMTGKQWALVIEHELLGMWLSELSTAERERIQLGGIAQASLSAFHKLDRIIIEQAATLTWRIGLSELVQFRFSEWDLAANGADKHKRYGEACGHAANIMQRKELPPVTDPDQKAVKRETVTELRLVLKRMRAAFALERKTPSRKDINDLFFRIVKESPELIHLQANADRWRAFVEENKSALLPGKSRVPPAMLYDRFLAFCTGWKEESLRQTISRLVPKL